MPENRVLVRQTITGLPAAPAFFAVARFVYQEGAEFGPAAGSGPVCMYVERGRLDFSAERPLRLTRAGAGAPEPVPPGTTVTVAAGDQLVVPGAVLHSARSLGPGPASMVGVASFPDAPPLQFPPGVSFEALALGRAERLPSEPVAIRLARTTLDSSTVGGAAATARPRSGPTLLHVESGALGLTVAAPGDAVSRAQAQPGPPPPPEPIAPGIEVTLRPGDAAMLQTGSAPVLRALTPVVYLEATAAADLDTRRELVRRYFYDAWGGGRAHLLDAVLAADFVNHDLLDGQRPGRDGVRQLLAHLDRAFGEASVSVDVQLADGDRVVTRYTFRGTHRDTFLGVASTGARVQVSGIDVHAVAGGRITDRWGYLDLLGLSRRLGAGRSGWQGGSVDAGP